MEWAHIVSFRLVARYGSVTKAAKIACRTQSAISQQIKALETELGCSLFERSGKRLLRVTEEGLAMIRFAESALAGRELLTEEIFALKGLLKGSLTLSAPFTTIWQLLPGRLSSFHANYPDVKLKILDSPQLEVVRLVESGEADIGFALESEIPTSLTAHRWKTLKPFLVVPSDHPLNGDKPVRLEDVVLYPLIVPPRESQNPGRHKMLKAIQDKGLTYKISMESSNVELNSLYVRNGLGLSFAMVAEGEKINKQKGTSLVPLDVELSEEHLTIFCRRERLKAPAVERMISSLLSQQELRNDHF
jgi:DNA-binding transcriptional LysR family regulator